MAAPGPKASAPYTIVEVTAAVTQEAAAQMQVPGVVVVVVVPSTAIKTFY